MQLASLGSGSRGNSTLVRAGDSCVMVDCGFSVREIERRAGVLQFATKHLDAILVTHEHSDHASGVAALSRRYEIPVYLTHGTLASGRLENCFDVQVFDADSAFTIGDLSVHACAVPHDAREPVQYVFDYKAFRAGVLTDLGSVTPHVRRAFSDCDLLLLEFNHDPSLLAEGPYPLALKRRVGGDWGHLSNEQAVGLLQDLDLERLRHLVIAHTSEKNNSRACIEARLMDSFPDLLARTVWATQDRGFPWLRTQVSAHGPLDRLAASL